MKRILSLLMAVCILMLCACAPKVEETHPPEASGSATNPGEKETESATQATTKPAARYRNPLTGEPAEEELTARPYAVMLNNYEAAMPVHGISGADIVYEALTEGGMTRCMGIFTDLAAIKTLGSIRSARRHFVNLAVAYDAIYVHYGKSTGEVGAQEYMDAMNWDHMDGTDKGYPYFYEDQDRQNGDYPSDACHFLVGQRAVDYATDKGFALARDKALDLGLKFDDSKVIVGKDATMITVWFNQGGTPGKWNKYTKLTYDKTTKEYLSFQYGEDNVDGNTGKTLSFRNVFVLKAPTKKNSNSEHMIITLEGEGEGYYACNGQLIPIKWSRPNAKDPFTYTLEDGTPLTLGVGKSYIAIVPTNATISYE